MNKYNEENPMPVYKEKTIIKEVFPREDTIPIKICHEKLKENKLIEIENFLSENQCNFLINLIENLKFESIDWEYPEKYRNNTRKVVFYEDLANYIWEKIESQLEHKDYWNIRPFGIGTAGKWYPYGINSCIRFSKYEQLTNFDKHKDGAFVITDNNRSIFTLMIYLNTLDNYYNGETQFYEKNTAIKINPVAGKAVIFNHDIDHEGLETYKDKYILRTDIMFFRIGFINDKNYLSNPDYNLAVSHFNNSIKLQHENKPDESTQEYIKGQDIISKYKSFPYGIHKISDKNENTSTLNLKRQNISHLKPFDNEKVKLNPIICKTIFEHLCTQKFDLNSLKELLNLRLVNSTWNLYLTNNGIWKEASSKILGYDFNICSALNLENTNSELYSIKFKQNSNFFEENNSFYQNKLSKSYLIENYDKDDRYMCYFINRYLTSLKKKRLVIDLGVEYVYYMYNFDNSPNHQTHLISDYYGTNRQKRCYRTLPWIINIAMNSWFSGFGARTLLGVEPIDNSEFKQYLWSIRRRNYLNHNFAQIREVLMTNETSVLLSVPYNQRTEFSSDYMISREKFFLRD